MEPLDIHPQEKTRFRRQPVQVWPPAAGGVYFTMVLHDAVSDQVVEQVRDFGRTQVQLLTQVGNGGIADIGKIGDDIFLEVNILVSNASTYLSI